MKRSTVGTSSQASKRQRTQETDSSATITIYRDYLKFFLLRELLAALENGTPEQGMTDEEAAFFEFIKHLEVGLTKFEEPSMQAKSAANKKSGGGARALLEAEYQLTYIFIGILRYKSKSLRNGWTKTFPSEFISDIQNIQQEKLTTNTFVAFCKALGKKRIKYFFNQIQEDPIVPEGLLPYEENGDYKIPDKDILLRERNQKEIFRISDVEGEETFFKYLLKHCSSHGPSIQTNIPARVNRDPFSPIRESSRRFSANPGLSFFNSHHSGITTIEREQINGKKGTETSQELPILNTEKEGSSSSSITLKEPKLSGYQPPYNGFSMQPDFLDWLEVNPLAASENGFELSPISTDSERMSLGGEAEKSYLVEQQSTLLTPLLSLESVKNSRGIKVFSETTTTMYRNYLKLTLLRELLLSLKKDTPEYFVTDEDKNFFEFIEHLEVGLTKLKEFPLGRNAKKELKEHLILEHEYQLAYIFICILRYKDRSPRNEWVNKFISQFMTRIKNIKKSKGNTFNCFSSALGRGWIKDRFVEIGDDPIAPTDLRRYAKGECYDVPDQYILIQESDKKSIGRTRMGGDETFLNYFVKYCFPQEPGVQIVAQTQVSSNSFQSEGENSSVLATNTAPSFFNGNPPDTIMIEKLKEPECRDGDLYNGLSMAPDSFDWLGDDPLASPERGFELSSPPPTKISFFNSTSSESDTLASPENGFELSSIFAEDEVMPLEEQREYSRGFTMNTGPSFFNSHSSETTTREIARDIGFDNTF